MSNLPQWQWWRFNKQEPWEREKAIVISFTAGSNSITIRKKSWWILWMLLQNIFIPTLNFPLLEILEIHSFSMENFFQGPWSFYSFGHPNIQRFHFKTTIPCWEKHMAGESGLSCWQKINALFGLRNVYMAELRDSGMKGFSASISISDGIQRAALVIVRTGNSNLVLKYDPHLDRRPSAILNLLLDVINKICFKSHDSNCTSVWGRGYVVIWQAWVNLKWCVWTKWDKASHAFLAQTESISSRQSRLWQQLVDLC